MTPIVSHTLSTVLLGIISLRLSPDRSHLRLVISERSLQDRLWVWRLFSITSSFPWKAARTITHKWSVTSLGKMPVVSKGLSNYSFFHNFKRHTISFAPSFIWTLFIQHQCDLKLIACLWNDGGILVLIQAPDQGNRILFGIGSHWQNVVNGRARV